MNMNSMKHKKMNIFLTGSSGFIGRNLLELLGKKYNIFAPTHKELELLDAEAVNAYIQSKKIDIIIHTANKGGGRDTKNMMNVVEYNTRMFFNLARNSQFIKKMIHLGSGAEYSKQRDLKKIEENDFDKYVSPDDYGFVKYICSKYIEKSDNIINEISDNPSEIKIINKGLNKEYSANNSRLLDELGKFKFTTCKDAIKSLFKFYKSIINKIDIKEIEEDKYIKYCRVNRNE